MTASLLNASLFPTSGAAGGAAGASAAQGGARVVGQGPLAGFEALLAALFGNQVEAAQGAVQTPGGQAATGGAAAAPAVPVQAANGQALAGQAAAPAGAAKDKASQDGQHKDGQHESSQEGATSSDAAAQVLALLAGAAQTAAAPLPASSGQPEGDTGEETKAAASGNGKAAGQPAPAAFAHADLNAAFLRDGQTAVAGQDAKDAGPTPAPAINTDPQTTPDGPAAPVKTAHPTQMPGAATSAAAPAAQAAAPAPAPAAPAPAGADQTTQAQPAQADAAEASANQASVNQGQAIPAGEAAASSQAPPPRGSRERTAEKDKAATASIEPTGKGLVAAPAKRVEGAQSEAPVPSVAAAAAATSDDDGDDARPAGDTDKGEPALAGADSGVAAQTAPPTPTLHTAAAVRGAPQTVANLAAQIVKKLDAKTTRFDVELDPAGLGKVNVRVDIGADGRISAALACHNPHAAEALKARSDELRQALEQAGFDLSGGGLSFEMAGGQGGGAGAGQGQHDSGAAFRGRAFATAIETAGDAMQAAAQGAALGLSRLNRADSGVDIRI